MQRLSRSTLGFIGSAQTLSWFPALAQRDSAAASTILNRHLDHVFRSVVGILMIFSTWISHAFDLGFPLIYSFRKIAIYLLIFYL
jgi:hypothetical protein